MLIIKVCVLWLYKNFSFVVLASQLQSLCYNLVMQVFMESLKRVLSFLILQIIHIAKYCSNYTIKLHWHRPVSYYSIPGLTGSTLNWIYFWHFLGLSSYICMLDLCMKCSHLKRHEEISVQHILIHIYIFFFANTNLCPRGHMLKKLL